MSDDRIMLDGIVINSCRSIFTIQVNESHIVTTTISGKLRQNGIKILNGDRVRLEVCPYDLSKGRIIYRYKGGE